MSVFAPTSRFTTPIQEEFSWLLKNSRAPKLRSCRRFFEEEMIVPTGPFAGRRARIERQPFTGLWLDAVDSAIWPHINTTGCGQGGKSFLGLATPLCYHLFEHVETVILGIPDADMADDKWKRDFLPVIERTRYRDLLPKRGEGSSGGRLKNMIVFGNGAMLKVMTGGGGDKSRAGFTSRVVIVTETDGFKNSAQNSEETNKLQQILSRTRAFGDRARVYTESTVSVEAAPTWHFHQTGTASRIIAPCPHCQHWVSPERGDFRGWEGTADVLEAMEKARFHCPACSEPIEDEQRREMNLLARLIYRGQKTQGTGPQMEIRGDLPRTKTFSFRFSAFHNLLMKSSDIAKEMYDAAADVDQESAEKKVSQFLWCVPYKPPISDEILLETRQLILRQGKTKRGYVPAWCECLSVGADIRKSQLHYVVKAWRQGFGGQVIDYGILTVRGYEIPIAEAIVEALRKLRDMCEAGWLWEAAEGEPRAGQLRQPDAVGIDTGWENKAVFSFLREPQTNRIRYRPVQGYGSGQFSSQVYHRPKRKGGDIVRIGDGYHLSKRPDDKVLVVELDADLWKTRVHGLLALQADDPGAVLLFATDAPSDHLTFARHLTSERQQIEYVPGKGEVKRWVKPSGENHYLDGDSYATCMAHFAGIRVLEELPPAARQEDQERPALTLPDGRPFFVGDR